MVHKFKALDAAFIESLSAFAANDYKFSNEYRLYKQSQQEGFQGFLEGLKSGHRHGYIELPTGVGKTPLFIALIRNYLTVVNGREDEPRVLILVPTEKLAIQTAKSFVKFMPEIAQTIETEGDDGQEIDWKNSDIGLQYSRVKHAHKKPKVLITTYQSQARDQSGTTYPPEDYGFVIYDEGHVITAPTFGLATDKFTHALQLAVTATPEYTKEKSVATRLPHLYFRLTLAEAISRGDLCNVRPAILKTGYTIDNDLFEHLMTAQNGTPLNERRLQQLLNQEARNRSVIETYFRAADPDSEERYLGQNGMVFCTTIKHADDIVRQFKEALKVEDGIKVSEWLEREELELIAAVHGGSKGSWLRTGMLPNNPESDRRVDGKIEWYTESEIFDLHEQGKILLLASVAKLKWGYDSPSDSLLFDLADRFSKVDATQIDGRAFRLNPDDPNKTATVFNLMDENTEELYKAYPHLSPIYCAEVIEGAEFRPPAKRPHAMVRFREPPPNLEKTLEDSGFELITNIKDVRLISSMNKKRREESILRPKSSEWLTAKEMAARARKSSKTVSSLYNTLQVAWKKAVEDRLSTFNSEGLNILVTQAGFFSE